MSMHAIRCSVLAHPLSSQANILMRTTGSRPD